MLSGSPCEPRSGERKRLTIMYSAPSANASTLFFALAQELSGSALQAPTAQNLLVRVSTQSYYAGETSPVLRLTVPYAL